MFESTQLRVIHPVPRFAALAATWLLLLITCTGCRSQAPTHLDLIAQADVALAPMTEFPDLQLGPGDEVDVEVYLHPNLTRTLTISKSGLVFYPLAGELDARGMSANDLRRTITEGLQPYLVDPQVSVGIKAIRSQKVVILGEVAQPGVYTMTGPMHILEAVSMAGGFGLSSDRSRVLHMRVLSGEIASAWVDINELLQRRGSVDSNPVLRTGDIVYVPPTAIADLARFARQVESIIRPVLLTQQAVLLGYDVKEAFEGDRIPSRSTIIIPAN